MTTLCFLNDNRTYFVRTYAAQDDHLLEVVQSLVVSLW